MSTLKTQQKQSKKAAKALLDESLTKLEKLEVTYKEYFGSVSNLSEASNSFESSGYLDQNPVVMKAVGGVQDAVASVLADFHTLETYIHLHVPKMEDGNNFGVTVQLAALKVLSDTQESLQKNVEELPKYYAARADALDKLNRKTETKTTTVKVETEDGGTTKTTTTEETKSTEGLAVDFHRTQAVFAVDVTYLTLAQKALRATQAGYLAVVDFCSKNKDKLESPKGSGGGSNYSSMY